MVPPNFRRTALDFNLPLNRRRWLGSTSAAAAAFASASLPSIVRAQAGAPIITRPLPRGGDVVPALGLGTFLTFDVLPGQPRYHLREVVRRYLEAGVRVIHTSPLYGSAESTVGDFVTGLGMNDQMFMANKIWSTGEYLGDESHALR